MEEQKKNQKPPFYSLVRARHTGGTPFRSTQPMKKPVIYLPPVTRSRTAFQKEFEFRATLNEPKDQNGFKKKIIFPLKPTVVNSTKNKENRPVRNNFKIIHKEQSSVKNDVKQKSAASAKTSKSRATRTKENQSEKNKVIIKSTIIGSKKGKKKVKPKDNVLVKGTVQNRKTSAENLSDSIEQLSSNDGFLLANNADNETQSSSIKNKIQEASGLFANKLAENVFIMSPLITGTTVSESIGKCRHTSTESDLVCEKKLKNKIEVKKNNKERNVKAEEENNSVGIEKLRKKLDIETARLNTIADSWSKRYTEERVPEDVKDEILVVVGQTRLLLSDKFHQFGSLIDNALSNHEPSVVIKFDDLLGFWEMVYLEVEQLDRKYQSLDELKNNEWFPCEKVTVMNKSMKKVSRKKPTKTASSKFREFLEKKNRGDIKNNKMHNIEEVQDRTYSFDNESCFREASFVALADIAFKKTPSIMRTTRSEYRMRRSSASTITLQKSVLAKAVLSPFRKLD